MTMSDTDMLYMAGLQKRIEALEKENAELKEHKSKSNQLLKAAVKDIGDMSRYCLGMCCDTCPHIRTMDRGYQSCIWQHEKEALALIGEDTNDSISGWISCDERMPEPEPPKEGDMA